MEQQRVGIIGGGISGLSAGIYAALNGMEVHIFERSSKAGGVCQSWDRNGYSVNGSIHWLMGSGPGSDYYEIWKELGVIEGSSFHVHDRFFTYQADDGKEYTLYTDVDRMQECLLNISPEDSGPILELCESIRMLARHDIPAPHGSTWKQFGHMAKMALLDFPVIREMIRWAPVSLGEYAARFNHPRLRELFSNLWNPEMTMIFLAMQMTYAHMGSASYPLGGSGPFIEKMLRRFLDLGGHFHTNNKVVGITRHEDRCTGILLENHQVFPADYVVSAMDGMTALQQIVVDEKITAPVLEQFKSLKPFPGILYFSAGFNYSFPEVNPAISGTLIKLKLPVDIGYTRHTMGSFQIYNFDPTLAAPGHTLVTGIFETDYGYWEELYRKGGEAYRNERNRIVNELVKNLSGHFPDLKGKLEFADAATPMTYVNETGNYHGSYEGWLPTPAAIQVRIPYQLNGLERFYLCGHWVHPGGGMPPAAFSGRNVVELICGDAGLDFISQAS
jgi:phytoene dehydrogenase-like protein